MMLLGVPIAGILFTVFQSIFQVFLVCLAGFILSYKGIIDKPTSKVLNHVNIALFTPALLFSKVAYFLTPAKLRQLWVIPVFFIVLTGLSAVIAHCLARACRLKRAQISFATAASMFMNSNSIPVALMQSLVTTVSVLKWGPDDTVDAMFGRSLTYLVVFSTLGMILRWSYGIRLIARIDEPDSPIVPTVYRDSTDTEHPALTRVTVESVTTGHPVDYDNKTDVEQREQIKWRSRPLHSHLFAHFKRHDYPRTHQHSHLPAVPTSLGDQSESEDSDELNTTEADSEETIVLQAELIDSEAPAEAQSESQDPICSPSSVESNTQPTPRWLQRNRISPLSMLKRILTAITSLSPPLVGSLLALLCVLVPPIQRLLQTEAMISFKGAVDSAGACSIPVTLIVLGGWFWNEETLTQDKNERTEVDHIENGSDAAKSKGKRTEVRQGLGSGKGPIPASDGPQGHPHGPTGIDTRPCSRHHVVSPSREASASSLSSLIGAFGDVLMARVHPRGGSLRVKRRVRGIAGVNESDVEPGTLAVHSEAENESSVNGLGSSSVFPQSSPNALRRQETNPPGESLTIFITLLSRMVIVPLVITPAMALISRLGWGGEVFEDPVFIVSCMLLIASPPALTLAQISQRAKSATGAESSREIVSSFERLLSRTVFWSYCILTPPLTIASIMVGLLLIGA